MSSDLLFNCYLHLLYSFCFSKLWGVLVYMLFDLVIDDLYMERQLMCGILGVS